MASYIVYVMLCAAYFRKCFFGCTISVALVFLWFSDGFHSTEYNVPYLKLVYFCIPAKMLMVTYQYSVSIIDLKTLVSFRDRIPHIYDYFIAANIDQHNLRKPVLDPILRKYFQYRIYSAIFSAGIFALQKG